MCHLQRGRFGLGFSFLPWRRPGGEFREMNKGCVLSLDRLHFPGQLFGAAGHVLEVYGDSFDIKCDLAISFFDLS